MQCLNLLYYCWLWRSRLLQKTIADNVEREAPFMLPDELIKYGRSIGIPFRRYHISEGSKNLTYVRWHGQTRLRLSQSGRSAFPHQKERGTETGHNHQQGDRTKQCFNNACYHRAQAGRVAGFDTDPAAYDRNDQQHDKPDEREEYS